MLNTERTEQEPRAGRYLARHSEIAQLVQEKRRRELLIGSSSEYAERGAWRPA
jgi:hypothetical protein